MEMELARTRETTLSYLNDGLRERVTLTPMRQALAARGPSLARRGPGRAPAGMAEEADLTDVLVRRLSESRELSKRFNELASDRMVVVSPRAAASRSPLVITIATETVTVDGARLSDVQWALDELGARVVTEGREGKTLLRVPADGGTGITRAFELAEALQKRGVGTAHPNFIRALMRTPLAPGEVTAAGWAHAMIGVPEAWKVTRGRKDIRVAVLDEGVDTSHPALRAAVVAQRDFIGGNGDSATPAGNDAHGTACAGIVCSRSTRYPGVAPEVSLIAARIAMGDGQGHWIFDDFATADAIDWCWGEGADVLSNSWGGGPPVDSITRAFDRARTRGRNGKGSVVVIATGNNEGPVSFPATLQGVLAVGASNQYDERKTRRSRDRENWWGSNYGKSIGLLAPGVRIATTDIEGAAGYEPGDFTTTFNGTSAATPHVAGTAALVLSVAPGLTAAQVRALITSTAHKLGGQTGWTEELGHGRLDVAAAVAAAQNAPPSPAVLHGAGAPSPKRAKPKARRQGRRPGKGKKAKQMRPGSKRR